MSTKLIRSFTKWAFKAHGWLGLAAGIFFLLFGLTGSVLMFRSEIEHQVNAGLHHLPVGKKTVPVDKIYRDLVVRYPNLKKIVLHDFPVDSRDSYEFMLYKNQQEKTAGYLYFVFVDPYTGRILKEGSYSAIDASFMRWLYQFHYSLQLGMPGKLFSGFIGLVMLLSLLTGIVIYRKHFWDALLLRGVLNFKNQRTAVSSLHRVIGVWAMVFNAILFFTGFWMNLDFFQPAGWKISPPFINQSAAANMDSIIAQASRVRDFTPIAVTMPTVAGQPVIVRGKFAQTSWFLLQGKSSDITYDQISAKQTGQSRIESKTFSKRLEWQIYQLHIGSFGGLFIKIFYMLIGLTPGFLSITGAVLWLKRKNKVHRKDGRRSTWAAASQ